jgi:hypothetical protein
MYEVQLNKFATSVSPSHSTPPIANRKTNYVRLFMEMLAV